MSKKSKKRKKIRKLVPFGQFDELEFELEEDAEALLEEHLAAFGVPEKVEEDRPASVRKKAKKEASVKIDLHGKTLAEAKLFIRAEVARHIDAYGSPMEFLIITGKGRHSEGPGVLVNEVHGFVAENFREFIVKIDDNPGNNLLGGIPIVGHFRVTLKK